MSIVLRNQVEATERSADELEAEIHHQHRRAMLCYDVQDLARSVTSLFRNINADVERWQATIQRRADIRAELEQCAEDWDGLYRRLASVFGKTSKLIASMEEWDFVVEGKSEFQLAWRDLRGITCFSRERIAQAVEQSRRGELRSLGEVAGELSDSPDA